MKCKRKTLIICAIDGGVEWRSIMKNVKNIQTTLLKRDGAQCSILEKG